jgi:hypothetical protein
MYMKYRDLVGALYRKREKWNNMAESRDLENMTDKERI